MEIHKMDVKRTLLHGDFYKEIYMEQPPISMVDYTLVFWL